MPLTPAPVPRVEVPLLSMRDCTLNSLRRAGLLCIPSAEPCETNGLFGGPRLDCAREKQNIYQPPLVRQKRHLSRAGSPTNPAVAHVAYRPGRCGTEPRNNNGGATGPRQQRATNLHLDPTTHKGMPQQTPPFQEDWRVSVASDQTLTARSLHIQEFQ